MSAQVILGAETLPEVNDVLQYQTFMNYEGSESFRDQGEDLTWSFDDIELTGTVEEAYIAPDSALLANFPQAEFAFNLAAFATAGIKTDSTLELIGVGGADLLGFEFNAQTFEDPFVLRSVPMSYGDMIEDRIDLPFTIDAATIPGLDSLQLPVPGTTLDSIRITTEVYKKETATAWGTLDFMGIQQEVLKVEQVDSTDFSIEIGLGLFGQILWVDASDFIDLLGGGGPGGPGGGAPGFEGGAQGSLTHKFLVPDSRLSVLEFQEITAQDTSGVDFTVINGRVGEGMLDALAELGSEAGLTVYPNPVQDRLYLKSENASAITIRTATLLDFQGNLLRKWRTPNASEGFDLSGLSAGAFIILVDTGEELISTSFVKTD